MKIAHETHDADGRFYLEENGQVVAELNYRYLSPTQIDAYRTHVDDSLRGQGVAGRLYEALMAFTEEAQLTVEPSCSYIAKKMGRSVS
ncbi:MAG: N-acetyltransferase [Neisseriaceae bacterium]|nr:N-acetyltransferase [Neisseriaceae bacterium]MBP6861085.1 N-acetyltransferase [Neisseriaceae bacterium]